MCIFLKRGVREGLTNGHQDVWTKIICNFEYRQVIVWDIAVY
jgi:hypothetical protein